METYFIGADIGSACAKTAAPALWASAMRKGG